MKHEMRRIHPWALGLAGLLLVSWSQSAQAQIFGSDPEGIQQTEKLIDRADDLVKEGVKARGQIQKTLDSYNSLFSPDTQDLTSVYKDVEKGMNDCAKQKEEVQKRIDEMSAQADTYFAGWGSSLKNIQTASLRQRSEERMKETRERFNGILAAAREAQAAYDPFMTHMKDQWTYLGHDLNASGVASLKPDADKLNQEAQELFKKIDEGLDRSNNYISSLRSEKPPSE